MAFSKSPHNLPIKDRLERFFVKGDKDQCWFWLGTKHVKGYGEFRVGRRMIKAHRVAHEVYIGTIPDGLQVLHSCDNHGCVNPSHLSVGTNLRNQHEAWARDRKRGVRKLSRNDVIEIRASNESQSSLAEIYGVNPSQICRIRNGTRGVGIMLTGTVLPPNRGLSCP